MALKTNSINKIIGDPFSARLIAFNDIHRQKNLYKERGKWLEQLGSESERGIVLVEGAEQRRELSGLEESYFTKKKFHWVGWEDPQHMTGHNGLNEMFAVSKKYAQDRPFSSWSKKDIEAYGRAESEFLYNSQLRTKNLIKEIRFYLKTYPGKKIFVISGKNHLYTNSFNILNCFKNTNAALILFKKQSNDPQEELRYLELLHGDLQAKEKNELFPVLDAMLPPMAVSLTFEYAYED